MNLLYCEGKEDKISEVRSGSDGSVQLTDETSRGGWIIYSTLGKNGGGDCLNVLGFFGVFLIYTPKYIHGKTRKRRPRDETLKSFLLHKAFHQFSGFVLLFCLLGTRSWHQPTLYLLHGKCSKTKKWIMTCHILHFSHICFLILGEQRKHKRRSTWHYELLVSANVAPTGRYCGKPWKQS